MKSIITGIVLSILAVCSSTAMADNDDYCQSIHALATTVMESRHLGAPLNEMLPLIKDNPVVKAIVLDAYKQHLMRAEENKVRQVVDFADGWYLACVEGA